MTDTYLFTSESVSAGHPDKVADQISDAILDDFLRHDSNARVAAETLVCTNRIVLAGEQRSDYKPNYEKIAREAVRQIGYTQDVQDDFTDIDAVVDVHMNVQSQEIAQGVDAGDRKREGAGDQGIMFGYAVNETDVLMPAPLYYAHEILKNLSDKRAAGQTLLRPDAKSQLTLEYVNGKPVRVNTALVSHQHSPDASQDDIRGLVVQALEETLPTGWIDADTKILTNPTGSFVKGGPAGDTGLTGRKIIVDTYGGAARHGGGAFSGKDPTKVDRSAAYAARYLAKNIVAAELADKCEIQFSYAIGVPEPLAIYVSAFGTLKQGVTEEAIVTSIYKSMDLTPRGLLDHLQLCKPIYQQTAAFGHFGRIPGADGSFSWEKTDLVETLLKNL